MEGDTDASGFGWSVLGVFKGVLYPEMECVAQWCQQSSSRIKKGAIQKPISDQNFVA